MKVKETIFLNSWNLDIINTQQFYVLSDHLKDGISDWVKDWEQMQF